MVNLIEEKIAAAVKPKSDKLHCALCQRDISIEHMLIKSTSIHEIVLHWFDSIEQLYEHNQRSQIDFAILAAGDDKSWLTPMAHKIKTHATLQFIPIMVYAPGADRNLLVASYKAGADDFIIDSWDCGIIEAKIEMMVSRSKRDLSVNPTTKLPGANAIEYEIERRLRNNESTAICYADLDNFKAYNDYYGYVYGDKLILITSHIIRNIVHDLTQDSFVGHIGGDDFIFLIPYGKMDSVCKNIIATFDRMVPFRYAETDRDRGWIEVANRRGEVERFPIMTISIAVIINQKKTFKHPGEMSHMMADLKKYTKSLPGSNYMVERRRKY